MTEQILQTIEDNIAVITFNRPDVLNAFSFEMRERFACIVEELAKDDDVRCIVITGNGRAFSAGGDIKGWGDLKDENKMKLLSQFVHRAVKGLIYMEKPVIAMVNGDAVGAGCNIALASDFIIASENARFGEVFVKIGLGPDWGGAYILPRLVGMAKAKELLFTGQIISAAKACEMGLIYRVVEHDSLEDEVKKLAKRLANSATKAIGKTKTFLNNVWQMNLDQAFEHEAKMQKELMQTIDHQKAVKSFINKEKPVFIGK